MNYQGKKMKEWKKYPYWSQFQIYWEKCHTHDGMLDIKELAILDKEIFEKFMVENIKVAVEKTKIPFRGRIN